LVVQKTDIAPKNSKTDLQTHRVAQQGTGYFFRYLSNRSHASAERKTIIRLPSVHISRSASGIVWE